MTNLSYTLLAIVLMAIITIATRVTPFLFIRNQKQLRILPILSSYLPAMIMPILVIYSVKEVSWFVYPHGLPESMAIGATIALHLWKRSFLISLFGGTCFYMVLLRII